MTDSGQRAADESEIRNLLNLVANLSDGDDLDMYLSCFTKDGVVAMGKSERVGHDEIRAGAVERRAAGMQGPGTNTKHFVGDQVIRVEGPDNATAESYALFIGDITTSPVIRAVARYRDSFTRTAEGWKLSRREISLP